MDFYTLLHPLPSLLRLCLRWRGLTRVIGTLEPRYHTLNAHLQSLSGHSRLRWHSWLTLREMDYYTFAPPSVTLTEFLTLHCTLGTLSYTCLVSQQLFSALLALFAVPREIHWTLLPFLFLSLHWNDTWLSLKTYHTIHLHCDSAYFWLTNSLDWHTRFAETLLSS